MVNLPQIVCIILFHELFINCPLSIFNIIYMEHVYGLFILNSYDHNPDNYCGYCCDNRIIKTTNNVNELFEILINELENHYNQISCGLSNLYVDYKILMGQIKNFNNDDANTKTLKKIFTVSITNMILMIMSINVKHLINVRGDSFSNKYAKIKNVII
jgi:hypothetical protein